VVLLCGLWQCGYVVYEKQSWILNECSCALTCNSWVCVSACLRRSVAGFLTGAAAPTPHLYFVCLLVCLLLLGLECSQGLGAGVLDVQRGLWVGVGWGAGRGGGEWGRKGRGGGV
jgi:hypothetical protein